MLHYSTPSPRRQRENTPQTRTVRLTQDGMKLLPHAQRLIAEYERLQVQADELNGLQSVLIRIGMFSSVVTHRLLRSSKNSSAIPSASTANLC